MSAVATPHVIKNVHSSRRPCQFPNGHKWPSLYDKQHFKMRKEQLCIPRQLMVIYVIAALLTDDSCSRHNLLGVEWRCAAQFKLCSAIQQWLDMRAKVICWQLCLTLAQPDNRQIQTRTQPQYICQAAADPSCSQTAHLHIMNLCVRTCWHT